MYVAGAQYFDRTVGALEPKGAIRFDPVELPPGPFARRTMNFELGAHRMGSCQPGLRELGRFGRAPGSQQLREPGRQQRRKSLRRDVSNRLQGGGLAPRNRWSSGQIDPETGDDPIARPFEQDAGKLGVPEHQVVGPFQRQRCVRRRNLNRLDQCQTRDQRESWRGRIGRADLDEGGTEKIAFDRFPCPAVAAAPANLEKCGQPVALNCQRVTKERSVGRAQPFNDPYATQNRDLAALFVRWPSGPISR